MSHEHDDDCHSPECDEHFKRSIADVVARFTKNAADIDGFAVVIRSKSGDMEPIVSRMDEMDLSMCAHVLLTIALLPQVDDEVPAKDHQH